MKQPRILIVGAGLAGLSVALAFARKGFNNLEVFEQADQLGEIGSGIQLGPNAVRILNTLGLSESLAQVSDSFDVGQLRNGIDNRLLAELPGLRYFDQKYGIPAYQLLRSDLHRCLLDAVVDENISIKTGKAFIASEVIGDQVRVQFEDGSRQTVDLLVGADGVGSRVREQLFPDSEAQYSGFACWRSLIERSDLDDDWIDQLRVWADTDRHMVAYPVAGSQKLNLVAVIKYPRWQAEKRTVFSSKADWLNAFEGFCPQAMSLIEKSPESMLWGLFEQKGLDSWHSGPQIVIGDAAHAMLPNLAQGAGQGIEDAVILAEVLADRLVQESSIEVALACFYQQRFDRVSHVQRDARWNLDFFHQRNGLFRRLRNLSMRMAGPLALHIIGRKYDWLYR